MNQNPVEVILTRQLAEYLQTPVFVVGPEGNLLFFNEAAQVLLGRPYEEAGEMAITDLVSTFHLAQLDGQPLPIDELPITRALADRRPCHRKLQIVGLDGVHRNLEVTAFPLVGQGARVLGAVTIFWEIEAS